MSNTSTVTPYEEQSESSPSIMAGAAAAGIAGAVVGAVALANWLAEETQEDRAAVQRAETESTQWKLTQATVRRSAPQVQAVGLCQRDPDSLLRSAAKVGFYIRPTPVGMPCESKLTLLRNAAGERLALERTEEGRIVLHAAAGRAPIEKLVQQHTFDRVEEHLESRGMSVRTTRLTNGEIQLLATRAAGGSTPSGTSGAAEVRAQVRADGSAWIDIEKVRGPECQQLVAGIADAIGGRVASCNLKDAYYQQPGEPTRTKERV